MKQNSEGLHWDQEEVVRLQHDILGCSLFDFMEKFIDDLAHDFARVFLAVNLCKRFRIKAIGKERMKFLSCCQKKEKNMTHLVTSQ